MVIAFWRSSGFPRRRGETLQVLGFVSVVLAFRVSVPTFCWDREFCLCFSCNWSGHDVCTGWFSEIVKLAYCDVRVYEAAFLGASGAKEGVDDGIIATLVVPSRGAVGGMFRVGFTKYVPSLCDVRATSLGFLVQVNSC